MIIRFLKDNWNELGPKTQSAIEGAGIAAGIYIASAIAQIDPSVGLSQGPEWLTAVVLGSVVAIARYFLIRAGNVG